MTPLLFSNVDRDYLQSRGMFLHYEGHWAAGWTFFLKDF
jgi:hypothetical protein